MFKVVKLRIPISIYELMKRSRRRDNYFISLHPSSLKKALLETQNRYDTCPNQRPILRARAPSFLAKCIWLDEV